MSVQRRAGWDFRRALLYGSVCVVLLGASSLCAAVGASAASPDPQGTIYVADEGDNAVDVFAPGASGNVAPERVIEGADTGIDNPGDVKVDSFGDVYVLNFSSDSITEYAPQASGDATPICTISGSNTGLDYPDDMSILPDGTLIVGNFADSAGDTGAITVYAPGACGNVVPERTIAGSNTGFNLSSGNNILDGVGADANGTIYADSTFNNSIQIFAPGANGNVAPVATISGPDTQLYGPDDIVVGFSGNLYVTDGYSGPGTPAIPSVEEFASGSSGDATPTTDIVGSSTGLATVDDLAVDASGNVYATDSGASPPGVLIYAAGSNGNVTPSSMIGGSNTTLTIPEGVAVAGPSGPPTGASVTTSASATSISVGSATSDTATVTQGTNNTSPTGSLVFKLFGPNDATCSNAPAYISPSQTVNGPGSYRSSSFTPTGQGTYSWQALYSGDSHNAAVTTTCNDPAETVSVTSAQINMVALGDSYSTAQGTSSFDPGQAGKNHCLRGPTAWPRQLQQDVFGIATILHLACSGATVFDMLTTYDGEPAQVPRTPDKNVQLVTLTVGGDDIDFPGILGACYTPFSGCDTPNTMAQFNLRLRILKLELPVLYRLIRRTYPNALIVHVGYPRILPKPGITPVNCGWLSKGEQQAVENMTEALDNGIHDTVNAFGDKKLVFAPVIDALSGHELCTSDSWMNPVNIHATPEGHPTVAGYTAYMKAVAADLGLPLKPSF